MCGICFTVKQHLLRRRASARSDSRRVPCPCPCRATSACGTRGDCANARSADCAASTTRQTSAPTTTTTAAVVLGGGDSSDVQSHALSLCPGTADMRIARIRCRDDRHLVVDDDDEDSATATATSHMQQQQRPQQHSDDDVDTTAPSASLFAKLVANVQARGPDKCGVVTRSLAASSSSSSSSSDDDDDDVSVSRVVCQRTDVQAAAAVLGLRGSTPVQQPYEVMPAALPRPQRQQQQQQHDDKDSEHDKEQACADCYGSCRDDDADDDAAAASFLMWNGEIFDGVLCPPPWGSDTVRLAHRLAQVERTCATAAAASLDDTSDDEHSLVSRQRRFLARCVDVMEGELEGPYGFVYYAATLRMAVFGRDPMGRHSLLTHLSAYVAHSGDACVSRAQSQRVCVELLVTSVGVQHAAQACGERALCAVAPHATAVSSDTPSSAGDAVCCPETKRARVECIADVCAAAVNDDGAAAVVRNATSSSNTHNTQQQQQQQQQQQERDKEAHKSNDDDEDATMAADAWSPCWAELPVTGLFAVRLQLPLLSTAVLPSTEHASCDAADADNNDSDGNAAAVPVSLPLSGVAADALLHCRWRRQVHCVHPLLRCLVHRESDVCGVVPLCSATDTAVTVTATTTTTAAARAANSAAAAAATAVGAASTTPHGVGASRGFYMQTDETPPPQLPRALVQRVRQYVSTATAAARATATAGGSRPPRQERHGRVGGCEEQSASDVGDSAAVTSNDDDADDAWAQWAAVRYVYALAAAVQRRIDVTRSGAGDSSSAATVHSARRRPLCILFSGGIDCVVLAALAHYLLPAETPIELANVAFGAQPEQAPDRVAALRAMRELLLLPQPWDGDDDGDDNGGDASTRTTTTMTASGVREREWRLVLIDVRDKLSTQTGRIVDLVSPRHTVMDFDIGTALWYAARGHGRMQVLRHSDVVDTVHDAEDAQEGGARGGATRSRVQQACSNGSNNNGNSNCSSADARHHHSHSSRLLAGFSKHVRVTGVTAPGEQTRQQLRGAVHDSNTAPTNNNSSNSSNKSSEVAVDGDGDEVQRRFGVLIDVLVSEGQHNGGPEQPVLLSTLGKEYGVFLQPHVARYGYKKLGGYLNDAAHAGVIAFARDAPSKAVRLSRPQDRRRAAALPPSRWFCTRHMMDSMQQAQHEQQQQQGEEQRQPQPQSPLSTTTSRRDDGDDDDTTHAALQPPAGTFVEHYRSCAKVMLLGMGADETLGGYTRYRRFFHRHGMRGARRELEADFARLWQRNLGRDDRVTMDSGREPRFPYLDEGVLRTLEYIVAQRRASLLAHGRMTTTTTATTTATTTCGNDGDGDAQMCLLQRSIEPVLSFRLSPGEGDKRVLRNVAAMLGLGTVTRLQKRAIQFGSRIAERRVKGSASL